jgi:5'-nucleotidase
VDAVSGTCDARKLREQAEVRLVPAAFLGAPVVPDPEVQALIAPALARVKQEQNRELGLTVPVALKREYQAESVLGDFLADALREAAGADVALMNPGGLRADIDAGPLTFGDVYEVLPFDNTVSLVTMTGDELRRLLKAAYGGRKGIFQVSGLRSRSPAARGRTASRASRSPTGSRWCPRSSTAWRCPTSSPVGEMGWLPRSIHSPQAGWIWGRRGQERSGMS